jgi:2-isopropylmalate synthase
VFKIHGKGNGLLDAFVNAFSELTGISFSINMYNEHSMNSGTDSAAITYVELRNNEDGNIYLGAGVSSSVTKSSIRAIVSGINRMIK